jgi:hypothetical protein
MQRTQKDLDEYHTSGPDSASPRAGLVEVQNKPERRGDPRRSVVARACREGMDRNYRDREVEALVAALSPEQLAKRSIDELIAVGGVEQFEREAIADALFSTRKLWLSVLQAQRSTLETSYGLRLRTHPGKRGRGSQLEDERTAFALAYLDLEIRRLKRCLDIKPPPDETRTQTRDGMRV